MGDSISLSCSILDAEVDEVGSWWRRLRPFPKFKNLGINSLEFLSLRRRT